jgi:hypothetical protein
VTFSERFAYRPLEMLSTGAQVTALTEPALALGVSWTPSALSTAAELAAGYPYALQLVGDSAWAAAGPPGSGRRRLDEHVDRARHLVDRDMRALFAARWSSTTPSGKAFLGALAWLQEESGVERSALADARGVSTTGISTVRSQLLEKGLIQTEGVAGSGSPRSLALSISSGTGRQSARLRGTGIDARGVGGAQRCGPVMRR